MSLKPGWLCGCRRASARGIHVPAGTTGGGLTLAGGSGGAVGVVIWSSSVSGATGGAEGMDGL